MEIFKNEPPTSTTEINKFTAMLMLTKKSNTATPVRKHCQDYQRPSYQKDNKGDKDVEDDWSIVENDHEKYH